jgi:hypothetical protein
MTRKYLRWRNRFRSVVARDLSPAPATDPEFITERTAPVPLFGLGSDVVDNRWKRLLRFLWQLNWYRSNRPYVSQWVGFGTRILCAPSIRKTLNMTGLPDYKPVFVPFVTEERQPFLLAGDLSPAPATYPEVVTERTAPAPLFGLAPHGVCPAGAHCCGRGALLPHLFTLT